mmetsp:Transcript_4812/g.11802  ORF Transcript_4812/g.11802 Transcript_4812/m.11802 type:complete len:239 (-) Transcript_4812:499-1215(-)
MHPPSHHLARGPVTRPPLALPHTLARLSLVDHALEGDLGVADGARVLALQPLVQAGQVVVVAARGERLGVVLRVGLQAGGAVVRVVVVVVVLRHHQLERGVAHRALGPRVAGGGGRLAVRWLVCTGSRCAPVWGALGCGWRRGCGRAARRHLRRSHPRLAAQHDRVLRAVGPPHGRAAVAGRHGRAASWCGCACAAYRGARHCGSCGALAVEGRWVGKQRRRACVHRGAAGCQGAQPG